MTTCEPVSNGGGVSPDRQLTLWSEDSPASPSPLPVDRRRRRTSGGSGQQRTWSFATYDPDGSCWRTCRVSLDGEWEMYSATWPRAGMTRSGTAYPRPPSVPLTDATVSSWLPTPAAVSYGANQSPSPGAAVRPSLSTMARTGLWPTPTATDGTSGRTYHRRPDGTIGLSLLGAVRSWPTPTARLGDPRRGQPSPRLARLRYRSGRRNLDDAVAIWPTPAARDYRHPNRQPYSQRGGGSKGEQLPNAVGGPLNPTWVEALMGFPLGWTDLDD